MIRSRARFCSWLLPFVAVCGCSAEDPEADGAGVPPFTGPVNTSPAPANPAAPGASTTPPATSNGGGETTPTPALQPPANPAPSGNGAGMQGGTPAATPPATTPPATTPPATTPPATTPPAIAGASAGCALGNASPDLTNVPNTIVPRLPDGYDGTTPVPLLFAFHGANRTNLEMRMEDSRTVGSALESTYVMAFVKSTGNAWDINADYPRFEAVLEQMLSQFCIDTEHLFAMGHSSGAQFIAQMLGNPAARETRLAGIVPVSSSDFGNPAWSPVPTMLIHGTNDTARGNDPSGAIDITQYTESNLCSTETQPVNVPSCTTIAGTNAQVDPGCEQYVGCAAPTLFCNHDDPNYLEGGNPTNHGWPCFANAQILAFLESLR